jgi:hypothetical protein
MLNRTLVPREHWSFDPATRALAWTVGGANGRAILHERLDSLVGTLDFGAQPVGFSAGVPLIFACDVALNVAITEDTQGGRRITGLTWNADDPTWISAEWIPGALQISFLLPAFYPDPNDPSSATIQVVYTDLQTGEVFDPGENNSDYDLSQTLTTNAGGSGNGFAFAYQSTTMILPNDDRSALAPSSAAVTSVFPSILNATSDLTYLNFQGAMLAGGVGSYSTKVALRNGQAQNDPATAGIVGLYSITDSGNSPLVASILNGRMDIAGTPIPSWTTGDTLHWRVPLELRERFPHLSTAGSARFAAHGDDGSGSGLQFTRLSSHPPGFNPMLTLAALSPDQQQTRLSNLNTFTSYDLKGADVVQQAVMQDMLNITLNYLDGGIWDLVMGKGTARPALDPAVSTISQSTATGGDASAFYKGIGTAVICAGLPSNTTDSYADKINYKRAQAFLQYNISNSAVYQDQANRLFQVHWNAKYSDPAMGNAWYLNDQIQNASGYATQIVASAQALKDNIQTQVGVPTVDPDLISQLNQEIDDDANKAQSLQCFWAYKYFVANTTDTAMAGLWTALSAGKDNAVVSRRFQDGMATLTGLDPSGYFANRYIQQIQTYNVYNVLINQMDLSNAGGMFSIVKLYVLQYVKDNKASQYPEIKELAEALDQMEADNALDGFLRDSLEVVMQFTDIVQMGLALPQVSGWYAGHVRDNYPKLAANSEAVSGLIMTAVGGIQLYSLIKGFKHWDAMSDEERGEAVTLTAQIGFQATFAVLRRGSQAFALYQHVGTFTVKQGRAMRWIKLTVGIDDSQIAQATQECSSFMAKWLGSTNMVPEYSPEGQRLLAENPDNEIRIEMRDMSPGQAEPELITTGTAEEYATFRKIFGNNLEVSFATRIGPVFMFAGLGFGIYNLIEGDHGGWAIGMNVMNVTSSSLAIFGTLGGMAVVPEAEAAADTALFAEGGTFAMGVSAAGPLAIVAAIAGFGIALYLLFRKKPDPVQKFVDNYAQPAGFAQRAKASSIDFAFAYNQYRGFSLSAGAAPSGLCATLHSPAGTVPATFLPMPGTLTNDPSTVFLQSTDGDGRTRITTMVDRNDGNGLVTVALSMLDDTTTVSFESIDSEGQPSSIDPKKKIASQYWICAAVANATTNGVFLVSLSLTIRSCTTAGGKIVPGKYLIHSGAAISLSNSPMNWLLTMTGLEPAPFTYGITGFYVGLLDLSYYNPIQPYQGSTPVTFSSDPELPSFLKLNPVTGMLSCTEAPATVMPQTEYTIQATNDFSISGAPRKTKVSIQVEAQPPPPPTA